MSRVGVFVCHCGENIARTVDCTSVAETAKRLPGVRMATDYEYMCSDPGQNLIREAIRQHKLDGVIVAACSPAMHEPTFRRATAGEGLNPFRCEMVNIREHCSWVHEDREEATTKASDLVRMMVEKVKRNEDLIPIRVPITRRALVVGGGIAGIQAALDLANSGIPVVLVEREPSIGGHMSQLSETFPTLDCSQCILTPRMVEVAQHPLITLHSYSEVEEVKGYIGNFRVTVRKKARYVDMAKCTGCGICQQKCPVKKLPSAFDVGLGKRPAIYIPFPQAVPNIPVIDRENCIYFKTGKCAACKKLCGPGAIDFSQTDELVTEEVGAAILATGFQVFDASRIPYYGYGVYPSVYTALEVERLISAAGPTGGDVLMRNGARPRTVGIVHCVGSRDEHTNRWCSRVCCMYSLKLAHLIKERTGAEVYNFYIDMRAPGKAMEEFYNRVAEEYIRLIRGKVADIYPEDPNVPTGRLVIQVEDTLLGRIRKIPVDMVILSVGLEPRHDAQELRRVFNISCSTEGFFLERHPKLAPVNTFTDGIFLAGCCQGPKDIPDTVAQASAAGAKVQVLFSREILEREPIVAEVNEATCAGCFACQAVCPYSAVEVQEIRDRQGRLLKKVARINAGVCNGCGTCQATCPSKSVELAGYTDDQVFAQIAALAA